MADVRAERDVQAAASSGERESLFPFRYEIVSQSVSGMPERVVMDYETREEADDALAWYTATFSPRAGSLWVRKVANDG